MTFDKILVPLDGSLIAEAALPKAVELIRKNDDATLILLRATEATTLPCIDPIDAQVTVVREAEEYLEAVAARLREDGVPGVKTSVWYGAAAPGILEVARMTKPDVIMMSTHGRKKFGRLFFGSVAESVLRDTQTPIFLIRVDGTPVETPVGRATARERETHDNPRPERDRPTAVRFGRGSGASAGQDSRAHDAAHGVSGVSRRGRVMAPIAAVVVVHKRR